MTEPAEVPTLLAISAEIAWPDTDAEADTHARLRTAGLGDDVLGRLSQLATWLSGVQGVCPPREPRRPRLIVFRSGVADSAGAADSAVPADSAGAATVFADVTGVGLRLVDLTADAATSDTASADTPAPIDVSTAAAVDDAIRLGTRVADEEIDAGADLLLVAAAGRAGPAADVVVSIMTLVEPVKVVGLHTTLADAQWMAWVADVRDGRARGLHHRHDPAELLATVGGPELAALTGFLLRAAARRTPVLFDGVAAAAAGLLAREVAPNVVRWWQPGARSTRPAHGLALEEYAGVPVLDLALGVDDGIGAVLAVPLLRAAARAATDLTVPGSPLDPVERAG